MSSLFLQLLNDKRCSRYNMAEQSLFIDYKISNNHISFVINQKKFYFPIHFFY